MAERLPMFPLGTVLAPFAGLPLHIFEPRYRVLMFDCVRGTPELGVVLIERGLEVGGDDQRYHVGTVARIADAGELPDGRWVVTAVGTDRIRILEWLPDDPYPVALVERLPTPAWDPADDDHRASAEREVRRALTLSGELGLEAPPATVELAADPVVASWQLVAIAPLGPFDKQQLLELDDPAARLLRLGELAEEVSFLLAHRLRGE